MKALSTSEKHRLVKNFNIPVTGFHRNFERAPEGLLTSAIKKELIESLAPKKRKRKPTTLTEMYEYIKEGLIREHSYMDDISLEELGNLIDIRSLSPPMVLALLYVLFPSVYEKKKMTLYTNLLEDNFLLEGIVKRMPLEKRKEQLEQTVDPWEAVIEKLEIFWSQVSKADMKFRKLRENAKIDNEHVLLEAGIQPEELKNVPILAFLLERERYKERKYESFLLHTLLYYDHEKDRKQRTEIDTTNEENEKLLEKKHFLERELKKKQAHAEKLQESNQIMRENIERIQKEKNGLLDTIQKLAPLLIHFHSLMEKHQAVVIMRDSETWKDTPFEGYTLSIDTLERAKKVGTVEKLKNKTVFLTRTAYSTTPAWVSMITFLENHNIAYCELLGYDRDDYIKQVINYLQTKERILAW